MPPPLVDLYWYEDATSIGRHPGTEMPPPLVGLHWDGDDTSIARPPLGRRCPLHWYGDATSIGTEMQPPLVRRCHLHWYGDATSIGMRKGYRYFFLSCNLKVVWLATV
jgi:hypothetical protein